jgi:hypothetical protein
MQPRSAIAGKDIPLPLEGDDRRGSFRYSAPLAGECRLASSWDAADRWPTNASDISESGLALVLSRRFEPGTLLVVTLASAKSGPVRMPLARVCRVSRVGSDWKLGCMWADAPAVAELRTLFGIVDLWRACVAARTAQLSGLRKQTSN